MPDSKLPSLLYVADVPVEATQHGSALMFRALERYPGDRLRIVETGLPSDPARRLPGVWYSSLPIGRRRWLDSRLHGIYSAWLTQRAASRADQIIASLSGFEVEAVATVGHGFGWLAAAAIAKRLNVPLHLIVHDDWPRRSAIAGGLRQWLDRAFADVYRGAATRLCISPFMADAYQRRYGVAGSVMYPSRSAACPVFDATNARVIASDGSLTIGYGGNSGPEMMACLETLAAALTGTNARLAVFGPFDADAQRRLWSLSPSISFQGFVPHQQMIRELHAIADVLFVPMTFAEADRDNQAVSFPSKLADYTAIGLPLLIYGPPYSSAVRWARAEDDVAEIVDQRGELPLRAAIERLRQDTAARTRLATNAVAAGYRCFDSTGAVAAFSSALRGGRR
jgi:hypothetical protein